MSVTNDGNCYAMEEGSGVDTVMKFNKSAFPKWRTNYILFKCVILKLAILGKIDWHLEVNFYTKKITFMVQIWKKFSL